MKRSGFFYAPGVVGFLALKCFEALSRVAIAAAYQMKSFRKTDLVGFSASLSWSSVHEAHCSEYYCLFSSEVRRLIVIVVRLWLRFALCGEERNSVPKMTKL